MKKNATITAISLLAAGVSQAATIAWTTSDIVDVSDIVTTGTLVEAINARGSGSTATDVTVAGVTFTGSTTLGNNNHNGDTFSFDTGDADYNSLLGSIDFGPNSQSSTTYTFSGLTEGQNYVVQFWYADGDGSANTRTMTLTGTGDNVLQGNDYAVGTFTADVTGTQDLTWNASANGIRVNALQLRAVAVPEPSSSALLGLGLLAVTLRRKR